jgi:PleD family two-component response regulator
MRVKIEKRKLYATISRSSYGQHHITGVNSPSPWFRRTRSSNARLNFMTLHPAIRILLVDDNPLIRTLIKERLIKMESTWEISQAKNGLEALLHTSAFKPDIAMLDLSLS